MKIHIIIFALLIGLGSTAFGQKGKSHHKRSHNPEMRKAMKAYTQENVLPVMQAQRQKLDASLSLSEKQEVEEIRSELDQLRETGKSMRQQMHKTESKPTEAQRTEMYAHRKAMRLLMNRAWEIADRHEADIQTLMTELEPQAENWKQEMRSIAEQYRPEDAPEREDRPERPTRPEGMRKGEGHPHADRDGAHRPKGPQRGAAMLDMRSPVRFLLWDASSKMVEEADERLEVFPNPARNVNEVRLRLEEGGNVQVKLLDKNGNLIRTVINETMSEGSHTQRIDLHDLEPGLYFYQITTPKGTHSRKIILE
ncbi:MAG: T9SS type A sorting domain-containing protein [Bacteroidia bacterium]